MTSANIASEPICASNDEARTRLKHIADALLMHDREIAARCDDSVARVIAGAPMIMRRSRGYVPRPIQLARAVKQPILACGAELKNSFCLLDGDLAYFGPHVGDLDSLATLSFFEEAVDHMQKILGIRPELVAYDLHPAYLSSRYARSRKDAIAVGVQHHHAHIVSVMAEHGLEGPVIGLAYDGTGYGLDGTSWGGEILLAYPGHFTRLATFRPISLPGGNRAMREVWRTALALLEDAYEGEAPLHALPLFQALPKQDVTVVRQMIERGLNAPPARGLGRYFDALGAVALNRPRASYEGQVAVAWNMIADASEKEAYAFDLDRSVEPMEIDLRPLVRAAVEDLLSGLPASRVSARFHNTLVEASATLVRLAAAQVGTLPVVLSGGVFQNAWLAEGLLGALSGQFRVSLPREVPVGDGGLALGQGIVAEECEKEGQRCA
jgi:hydrogenase maturation protein HypF